MQDLGVPLRAVGVAAIAGIAVVLVLAPRQTIVVVVVRVAGAGAEAGRGSYTGALNTCTVASL